MLKMYFFYLFYRKCNSFLNYCHQKSTNYFQFLYQKEQDFIYFLRCNSCLNFYRAFLQIKEGKQQEKFKVYFETFFLHYASSFILFYSLKFLKFHCAILLCLLIYLTHFNLGICYHLYHLSELLYRLKNLFLLGLLMKF